MKLSIFSLLTLGLTAGSLAQHTPVQRDLSTVTGVLSGIGPKVEALDSAIQSFSGGDVTKVQQASKDLVGAINAGTTKVKGTSDLSTSDALGLPGPVNELKDKITTAITHLSSKKSQFVKAGKGGETYNDLIEQKTAAKKLSDTIVSKVPESLQSLAGTIASGISDAIQKGATEFQDQAGQDGSKEAAAPKTGSKETAKAPEPASPAPSSDPAPYSEPATSTKPAAAKTPSGACVAAY